MSDLYMSYKTLEANENHFKTCTKCGKTLPATTEYFYKHNTGKYGLRSICKKCILEHQKQLIKDNKNKYDEQWYKNNRDKTKTCAKCGKTLPATTEYFHKKKTGKYGLNSICKKCRAKYGKQYRENNKDKIAEQSKQWYENNKDKIAEYGKQYYEDNKNKIAERHKQYNKQWYEDNKDAILERKKKYYATPQGQVVAFNKSCRRRAKEQNQGNGITKDQWLECMKFFGFRCAYSGQILSKDTRSLDHVKPLNQGGKHEIWNCVPMYRTYNISKHDKDMLEWYQEQDFYSEERLQKIYEWQEYAYNKYSKK